MRFSVVLFAIIAAAMASILDPIRPMLKIEGLLGISSNAAVNQVK